MSVFKNALSVLFMIVLLILVSCSGEKKKELPPPPSSVADVQKTLAGKSLHTTATGYYGSLVINDKPEAEWIDTAIVKEKMIRDVIRETNAFALQFTSDSTITVTKGTSSYKGRWTVDNEADEDEEHGIYLRVSYDDPEFKLPSGELQTVTYSFMIKGIGEKTLLLELPREINRRKLISLLEA